MHTVGKPLGTAGAIEYFKKDIRNQTQENGTAKADKNLGKGERLPELLQAIQQKKDEGESGGGNEDEDESGGSSEDIILGESITLWQGELAKEFDLTGKVTEKEFNRLCRGQHPHTKEQLIRHVKPRKLKKKKKDKDGNIVTVEYLSKPHRAGINHSVSAPKSVSLVAMKDPQVFLAHHNAEVKASKYVEKYTSAKMGGNKPAERTGQVLNASFLQYEARPGSKTGIVAPTLHTQELEFNLTKTEDGKFRAIETRESFRSQKLKTAVYRSYLIPEMEAIGYQMRIDERTQAPEVIGISREYIDINSPRQNEIIEKAEELDIKSTDKIASNYRRKKIPDKAEMIRQFNENEKKFDYPVAKAVVKAKSRSRDADALKSQNLPLSQELFANSNNNRKKVIKITASQAFDTVIKSGEEHFEEKGKKKFITEQNLLAEVLNQSLRDLKIEEVENEFIDRQACGELDVFKFSQSSRKNEKKVQHTEEISENIVDNKQIDHSNNQTDVELVDSNGRIIKPVETEQNERHFSENEKQLNPNGLARTENNGGKSKLANFFDGIKSKSRKIDEERSELQKTLSEMAQASGERPGESLEKAGFSGGEFAAIWNDRADDQAIGSGGEIEINSAEITEIGGGEQAEINIEIAGNQKPLPENNLSGAGDFDAGEQAAGRNRETSEDQNAEGRLSVGNSSTRQLEGRDNFGDRREIQHTGHIEFGEFDRNNSRSDGVDNESEQETGTTTIRDKDINGTGGRSTESSSKSRAKNQETFGVLGQNTEKNIQSSSYVSRTDHHIYHSDQHLFTNELSKRRGSDGAIDSGAGDNKNTSDGSEKIGSGQITDTRGSSEYDSSSERTITNGQEALRKTSSRAEQNKRTNVEKNPRTAESATQIINVKFYGGQLDNEVTDKLAMFIKNNYTPEEFIDELIQAKTTDQKDNLSKNLDQQLKILTESFGLSKRNLSGSDNPSHLARNLTEIEVKIFEEFSGEEISLKAVERLTESKSELNNNLSAKDNSEKSIELFEDTLSGQPVFDTELEYRVFEGLLYPHAVGFDEELITKTQKNVDRDENISREIVDLLQIAYGGQREVFTDGFKSELSDQIYYMPDEPLSIYDKIYQASWQERIEMFSPIVNNTAEQLSITIDAPQNELQRNQQLSDFVTQQMTFAYEQINNQKLANEMVSNLHTGLSTLSGKSPSDVQLNRISEYIYNDLDLPKFETSLDVAAYRAIYRTDEELSQDVEQYATKLNKIREDQIEQVRLQNLTNDEDFDENDESFDEYDPYNPDHSEGFFM